MLLTAKSFGPYVPSKATNDNGFLYCDGPRTIFSVQYLRTSEIERAAIIKVVAEDSTAAKVIVESDMNAKYAVIRECNGKNCKNIH